jgi:glycosyltransferase involved in cell wall biosynthesis
MKISLVLPTYKKEREVVEQLDRLYSYLFRKNSDFELIFVVDGYIDSTKEILDQYVKENRLQKVKVVGYKENRGKGYAVRYGMKFATGDVIGFTDADNDIQLRTFAYAINSIKSDEVLAVIPSKFHRDSNVEMSLEREVLANLLVSLNRVFLKLPKGTTDIGCGLKLFKKDLITRILPVLSVDGFAIDSDILNEIGKLGIGVRVIPFFMSKNRSDSTSTNFRSMYLMFSDILRLSFRNRLSLGLRYRNILTNK